MFYNKRNIALRTAYFFATAAISGAVGGLISYGVGQMDGIAGWSGWRWIILIIGIPTLVTAFIIPFVLPNSVEEAKFLTEEDRRNMHILRFHEPGQTKSGQEMNRADVMHGVKDWKTYAFAFAHYCCNTVLYGFSVFLPTIIDRIGNWSQSEVQALTIPVYVLGAITYISLARLSDVMAVRGYFVIGALLVMILGHVFLIVDQGVGLSFAGCFLVAMGLYTAAGTALSWLTSNTPRYETSPVFAWRAQLTSLTGMDSEHIALVYNSPSETLLASLHLICMTTTPTRSVGRSRLVSWAWLCVSTRLYILTFALQMLDVTGVKRSGRGMARVKKRSKRWAICRRTIDIRFKQRSVDSLQASPIYLFTASALSVKPSNTARCEAFRLSLPPCDQWDEIVAN